MYFQDQGIVFSKKDFKESDLLVTVYTKKYGKVLLQARGGKKITSKLSSHIEPANLVIINWVVGKNKPQLTGAVVEKTFSPVKQDYKKSFFVLKLLQLVDRLVKENIADQKFFVLLEKTLQNLETEEDLDLMYLVFGFKMLDCLGLNPAIRVSGIDGEVIQFVVDNTLVDIKKDGRLVVGKKKFLKILELEFFN
jgi:DNA repair protein RecO (recombination protein O)